MALRLLIRSAASPRSGKFRRDWIAAELTEESATKRGLIYSVASAEHEASIQRFGPVPENESPEDREAPWIMTFSYFASPRRPGPRGL